MTELSKIAVIVGEDEGLRSQLGRWLSGFGIDSVQVDRQADALTLTDRLKPDLVIVAGNDDTPELLKFVSRAARRGGDTRVMLCARNGDAALFGAVVAGGADECLVAPFDADILRFKLEQTGVLAAL